MGEKVGYWRWLARSIIKSLKSVKSPFYEFLAGLSIMLGSAFTILAQIADRMLGTSTMILTASTVLGFFVMTHGIYRDFMRDDT